MQRQHLLGCPSGAIREVNLSSKKHDVSRVFWTQIQLGVMD